MQAFPQLWLDGEDSSATITHCQENINESTKQAGNEYGSDYFRVSIIFKWEQLSKDMAIANMEAKQWIQLLNQH